jgi:hypothetical protein
VHPIEIVEPLGGRVAHEHPVWKTTASAYLRHGARQRCHFDPLSCDHAAGDRNAFEAGIDDVRITRQ